MLDVTRGLILTGSCLNGLFLVIIRPTQIGQNDIIVHGHFYLLWFLLSWPVHLDGWRMKCAVMFMGMDLVAQGEGGYIHTYLWQRQFDLVSGAIGWIGQRKWFASWASFACIAQDGAKTTCWASQSSLLLSCPPCPASLSIVHVGQPTRGAMEFMMIFFSLVTISSRMDEKKRLLFLRDRLYRNAPLWFCTVLVERERRWFSLWRGVVHLETSEFWILARSPAARARARSPERAVAGGRGSGVADRLTVGAKQRGARGRAAQAGIPCDQYIGADICCFYYGLVGLGWCIIAAAISCSGVVEFEPRRIRRAEARQARERAQKGG